MKDNATFAIFCLCVVAVCAIIAGCNYYQDKLYISAGLCRSGMSDGNGVALYTKCH